MVGELPQKPPFGRPELRALSKLAAELGLMIQLHFEPRYAPGFEPLIQEFAETKVLIDHLGCPFQGTPEEHGAVIRWSRFPLRPLTAGRARRPVVAPRNGE